MRDRQPTHPGRIKITPENGDAFYAVMEMADDPTDMGTPPTKANLLTDETEAALFGSAADRTVNQAFNGIAARLKLIASNMAQISVTVKSAAGNPIPGVQIGGTYDENGAALITGADGAASGYVNEGLVTLSVSEYGDLENYSETFSAEKGLSYTKMLTLTPRNFLLLDTSKNVKFSENVSRIDATVVGGGGGGGAGYGGSAGTAVGGGGGGGGTCVVREAIPFAPNVIYPAIVGSAGSGAKATTSNTGGSNGTGGGQSSFAGLVATGGLGGGGALKSTGGAGGSGNGNGGTGKYQSSTGQSAGENGVAGGTLGFSSFTESVRYGGGGGGGSAMYAGNLSSSVSSVGGADFGGAGGSSYGQAGATGTGPGGGGGGGGGKGTGGDYSTGGNGGNGHKGCVAIRMHLTVA